MYEAVLGMADITVYLAGVESPAAETELRLASEDAEAAGPWITWLNVGVTVFWVSALRADKPSLVGSPANGLDPAFGCLGIPKRSSRLECGCNKCG